ncbi:MAG: alpha/beta hydrolase [Neisseriaceae bacterium]
MHQKTYQPESQWFRINGLKLHVRHWGCPGRPKLLLLHGWMDASASFQWMVDELLPDWDIYAPDWRGMGLSEHMQTGYYDRYLMLSDLNKLVELISPHEPLHMLGHSMGGVLLSIYAGVCPNRVKTAVLMEGFGQPKKDDSVNVQQLGKFLEENLEPRGLVQVDREHYIKGLIRRSPLLNEDRALYLSNFLLKKVDNKFFLRADPRHRIDLPTSCSKAFYQLFWQQISAPILCIQGDFVLHNRVLNQIRDDLEEIYSSLRIQAPIILQGVGHMVHWEAPEAVAEAVRTFLKEA